jgi:hypothetical protein
MTDTTQPTQERVRHAGDHYVPPISTRERSAPYGRVMTPIERLHERGQITNEMRLAGEKFVKHYELGTSSSRVTGSYGERLASSSEAEGPPELCRTHNYGVYQDAVKAINRTPSVKALIAFAIEGQTLATVGRVGRITPPKSDQQANAAGVAIIEDVLDRLAVHFGMYLKKPPKC